MLAPLPCSPSTGQSRWYFSYHHGHRQLAPLWHTQHRTLTIKGATPTNPLPLPELRDPPQPQAPAWHRCGEGRQRTGPRQSTLSPGTHNWRHNHSSYISIIILYTHSRKASGYDVLNILHHFRHILTHSCEHIWRQHLDMYNICVHSTFNTLSLHDHYTIH